MLKVLKAKYTENIVYMCMLQEYWLVGWMFGFYGISTFVGYLTPNPFLYKKSVLFQTIQFSMNTQFNYQKHFYFKLFCLTKQFLFKQFIWVKV